MDRLLRIAGVISIVYAVWRLFHLDWLTFVMNSALGISFLDLGGAIKAPRLVRALCVVAIVLAILRLLSFI
jgi:hypothetical protein